MSQAVEERANAIIKARGFDGLSDMIAALVREEFERRHPEAVSVALREDPAGYHPSSKGQRLAEEIGEETLRKHEQRAARGKKSHGKPAT